MIRPCIIGTAGHVDHGKTLLIKMLTGYDTDRLKDEKIAWFTTVSQDGTPQPRPVWFYWNGQSILIFSQAHGHKVRHVQRNNKAALHLDGDGQGGDIIVLVGEVAIDDSPVAEEDLEAYIEKYHDGFVRIGTTPEAFAKNYPIAIRMIPTKVRGH